jgi:hypothetical protein
MIIDFLELHPPCDYALIWQHIEGGERLTHRLIACSEPDAVRRSEAIIVQALAANHANWGIVGVHSRWREWDEQYEAMNS